MNSSISFLLQEALTITAKAIWVESESSSTAASVAADIVMAVMLTLVCHLSTLVNIYTTKKVSRVA